MFIRKRCVKTKRKVYEYYGIVETVRGPDKKPRQKMLYDMGKLRTVAECVAKAQKQLDYWLRQDQQQLEAWAATIGMEVVPNIVST